MADTKVYDPADYTMVLGVIGISSGYADGTFIEIEQAADAFSTKVGADGQVTRVKSQDRSGTVTITLMATADANNLMTAQLNLDRITKGGAGIVPLMCRDRGGNQKFFAAEAWIMAEPKVTFSKDVETRQWKIGFAKSERVDGGS